MMAGEGGGGGGSDNDYDVDEGSNGLDDKKGCWQGRFRRDLRKCWAVGVGCGCGGGGGGGGGGDGDGGGCDVFNQAVHDRGREAMPSLRLAWKSVWLWVLPTVRGF